MWRFLFKTVVLCAAVFTFGSTGNSQTIECDGLAEGGSGNFNNAVTNCPPFTTTYDYIYKITDPTPEAPESVYIGTHDGILSNYTDICLPAGWTFNIVSASPDHHFPFKADGNIVSPSPQCSFFMEFIGSLSAGTAYIGFNHESVPHQVSWEIGTSGPNVLVDWADLIGSGTGPVHAPFACDSLGTTYFGDGDCNVDGNVLTVADLVYLIQFLQGLIPQPTELYHSDLNGDCIVDTNDINLYVDYFANGFPAFAPYGGYPVPTCCSLEVVFNPGDSVSSLCGIKFEDLDCDGIKDFGEPPLANWTIRLYQGATQIDMKTTNANGEYCFTQVLPGTYRVREDIQPGWVQTLPSTIAYLVTTTAGQVIQNLDFGNTRDSCFPPSVLQLVNQVGGVNDMFSTANGPEPSIPDPVDMAGICVNSPNHFFDSPQNNNCFGHTFTGFNPGDSCCVIDAELCLRIRGSGSQPHTDVIQFVENGVFVWGLSLNTLLSIATNGVDSSFDVGDILDTCINLANLPPGTVGITNVLAVLQDGDFSVVIQDDTEIDYLELRVTLCCPDSTVVDSLGACCLPDGSCVSVNDANECASISGGTGTFFANTPCVPLPPNCIPDTEVDICENFTTRCCDGQPTVAKRPGSQNFTGQIAVASCYTDSLDINSPYVVGIIDLTTQCTAPIGTPVLNPNGFIPPMYHNEYPGNPTNLLADEWSRANLGTVFGLTLDTLGNIYVAATSCYSVNDFSAPVGTGTGGDVYRLDGVDGEISFVADFPNTGQGLGDVSYNCQHDNLYVSNMEDGFIYNIQGVSDLSTATLGIPYDHGVDGRAAEFFPQIPDDNLSNFTELGRRIWALQVVMGESGGLLFDRLFYSVWWEDQGNKNGSERNEIWSVELVNGDIVPSTARREIQLPSLPNDFYSNPVSDISFTADGRMILAERTMNGASTPGAHASRLLSYRCVNGVWTRDLNATPDDIYQIPLNGFASSPSSAGGVDVDFRTDYPSTCVAGRLWATGDGLRFGGTNIYGLAGFPISGGNSDNSTDCILIDLDAEFSQQDKTEIGDVEIPCRCCRGNRGDVNGDGADGNIVDLTYLIDWIFRGGPRPPCMEEADVNGDGDVNILDLTFLVDRIFRGGKAPGPCSTCCGITGR